MSVRVGPAHARVTLARSDLTGNAEVVQTCIDAGWVSRFHLLRLFHSTSLPNVNMSRGGRGFSGGGRGFGMCGLA